jgi:hypothetical protein
LANTYKKFCHQVSLADYVVIAAEVVMAHLSTNPE